MSGENSVRAGSIRLSTGPTTLRTTQRTDFGTVMQNGLMKAGNVVADGLRVASPYVPGAAILSAALAGATPAAQMTGSRGPAYGMTGSGLTAGGSGPVGGTTPIGTYGSGGTLAIPGQRPNLGTDLSNTGIGTGAVDTTAAGGSTDAFNQMMAATREMTEFQASFNLQYLQLQERIQMDTRQFNLISNIMKTKHDAAKNALNNVR